MLAKAKVRRYIYPVTKTLLNLAKNQQLSIADILTSTDVVEVSATFFNATRDSGELAKCFSYYVHHADTIRTQAIGMLPPDYRDGQAPASELTSEQLREVFPWLILAAATCGFLHSVFPSVSHETKDPEGTLRHMTTVDCDAALECMMANVWNGHQAMEISLTRHVEAFEQEPLYSKFLEARKTLGTPNEDLAVFHESFITFSHLCFRIAYVRGVMLGVKTASNNPNGP